MKKAPEYIVFADGRFYMCDTASFAKWTADNAMLHGARVIQIYKPKYYEFKQEVSTEPRDAR